MKRRVNSEAELISRPHKEKESEVELRDLTPAEEDEQRAPLLGADKEYGDAPETSGSFPQPGKWWWYRSSGSRLTFADKVLFRWINPVLTQAAAKGVLKPEDVLKLPKEVTARELEKRFNIVWGQEIATSDPSLRRALHTMFRSEFWVAGAFRLGSEGCNLLAPMVVRQLILFVEGKVPGGVLTGCSLAIGLFIVVLGQAVLLQQFIHGVFIVGAKLNTVGTAALFSKALRLSRSAIEGPKLGHIINLQTSDLAGMRDVVVFAHNLWASPLTVIGCTILLLYVLGPSALIGVALFPVLIPLETWVADKSRAYSKRVKKVADTRISLVREVVDGIKTVKLGGLESVMGARIRALRDAELNTIRSALLLGALNQAAMRTSPILVALATFTTYSVVAGRTLTPDTAFAALALFNTMSHPFHVIPKAIQLLAESSVALGRLQTFLLERETRRGDHLIRSGPPKITISRASFSPSVSADVPPCITDVSETLPQGLCAVVGGVGSGKSTLLKGLLEHIGDGDVETRSASCIVAYLADRPWVINATVRRNIVMALNYDAEGVNEERYRNAVAACALETDLMEWPNGDMTVVGERGITVSGGQKARIALARALYSDADVVILDDPLSALDNIVGRKVMEDVIKPLAKRGVVVMSTHQTQFLRDADLLVVVEGGAVKTTTVDMIQDASITQRWAAHREPGNGESLAPSKAVVKEQQRQVEKDKLQGRVAMSVYIDYIKYCGVLAVFAAFCAGAVSQGVGIWRELVLAEWADSATTHPLLYLATYSVLCLTVVLANIAKYVTVCFMGLIGSRRMHRSLLSAIMAADLHFFETTSSGRITSRFSADIGTVDIAIPTGLSSFGDAFLTSVSTLAVIVGTNLPFALFLPGVCMAYWKVQSRYRAAATELKRLDSASRSPVLSHFQECLDGLLSLQGYKLESAATHAGRALIDRNAAARLSWDATNRWLGIHIDLLGAVVVLVAGLLTVLMRSVSPGVAGLGLSYALSLTRHLSFGVRSSTAMENQFNSVERIVEFTKIPPERGETVRASDIRNIAAEPSRRRDFPTDGVLLEKVMLRYQTSTTPAVKGVTLHIRRGERVGICGRTGCGKSTLALGLASAVECCGGSILLEGVDVRLIPLEELRSKVAVISQDAHVFSGTVRTAVDPRERLSDPQIWQLIDEVGLGPVIRQSSLGLGVRVDEGGSNWSAGQRQLLCVARALGADASVLVFDEATAKVDADTDTAIQSLIRRSLKGKTVIVIAHRLEDVLGCDRVVVMDAGLIIEEGSPKDLLLEGKGCGAFLRLVNELDAEHANSIKASVAVR